MRTKDDKLVEIWKGLNAFSHNLESLIDDLADLRHSLFLLSHNQVEKPKEDSHENKG